MNTKEFIEENYNLFSQRSLHWQGYTYIVMFLLIFFISLFAFIGMTIEGYHGPSNPLVAIILWSAALAFLFFGIFLLWDNLDTNQPMCTDGKISRLGKDIPYVCAIIIVFSLLLGTTVAFYYWRNHLMSVVSLSLAVAILLLISVRMYKENSNAGYAMIPVNVILMLALIRILFYNVSN
jgi:glucan phosphoethanolaminetransferase (alkaline phosphatase superfamily)